MQRAQLRSNGLVAAGKYAAAIIAILALFSLVSPLVVKALDLETKKDHDQDIQSIRGLLLCIYQEKDELECPAYQQIIVGDGTTVAARKP